MPQDSLLTDFPGIRKCARQRIEGISGSAGHSADCSVVLKLLNDSLATELASVLRYRRHHFTAVRVDFNGVAAEFLAHSIEELDHADRIAHRIVQLGGQPDFAPSGLASRSHADYIEGDTLANMVKEDLVAERLAIDRSRAIIRYLGDRDPITRRMMESILAAEEAHADELADLLVTIPEPIEHAGTAQRFG